MKKMRYLDYDGFSWCCLHGGANSVTYKKPLIDFLGHAKLAYWVNRMVLQPTLAGSHNVDVVYGPDDVLEPVIMHLGEDNTVSLDVIVKDMEGKEIQRKSYDGIPLKAGRNTVELEAFKPTFPNGGHYVIEYVIR